MEAADVRRCAAACVVRTNERGQRHRQDADADATQALFSYDAGFQMFGVGVGVGVGIVRSWLLRTSSTSEGIIAM